MEGIIIIKPDGIKENVEKILEIKLMANDVKILNIAERQLSPKDIEKCFFCSYEAYIEYMCSSIVKAYLVEYHADRDVLYDIKNDIRDQLIPNYSSQLLKNKIHSADEGLEFFLQKSLFFPRDVNYARCEGCDYLIKNISSRELLEIVLKTNLTTLGILIRNEEEFNIAKDLKSKFNIYYVIKNSMRLENNVQVDVYYYYNSINAYSEINSLNRESTIFIAIGQIKNAIIENNINGEFVSQLDYYQKVAVPYKKLFYDIYLKLLNKGIQINAMLIELGNMSIKEANCRYFFSEDNNLVKLGGSNSEINMLGQYSLPNYMNKNCI